jgi:hypothetical protein
MFMGLLASWLIRGNGDRHHVVPVTVHHLVVGTQKCDPVLVPL